MKINILKSIIVLGIGLLIGWGFLAGSEDTDTGLIMAIIVCICLLIAGEIMFGIEFKQKREGIMLKTSAGGWAFCVLVLDESYGILRICSKPYSCFLLPIVHISFFCFYCWQMSLYKV